MSFHTKLILLCIMLVAAVLIPWAIWHVEIDAYLSSPEYQQWLFSIKPYAWLICIALLIADLFLPIPGSVLITAMGQIYGTFFGGLIAAVGLTLAGLTAYVLARFAGKRVIRWIASDKELDEFQHFFDTYGAGGIMASRALPVLPEVLTLLAGFAKMKFSRFMLALLSGSFLAGFVFAWAGDQAENSLTVFLVVTGAPILCWIAYAFLARKKTSKRQAGFPEDKQSKEAA